jgi:hypothetical protein
MDVVLQVLGVAAIAVVSFYAAVPAGIAMGLPAPLVWVAALAGALLGIAVIVLAGDAFRAWLVSRFGRGGAREGGRLRRLWDGYGVIGWGLLAPLLVGTGLAAAIGVALGAERRRLVLWLGAGAALWTTVLAVAVVLGADAVTAWL